MVTITIFLELKTKNHTELKQNWRPEKYNMEANQNRMLMPKNISKQINMLINLSIKNHFALSSADTILI